MRGKHIDCGTAVVGEVGSSPHARETLLLGNLDRQAERLIPACAGNTRLFQEGARPIPAHPRMRGKHLTYANESIGHAGSSPHARETPDAHGRWKRRRRLIPACAGNTRVGQSR